MIMKLKLLPFVFLGLAGPMPAANAPAIIIKEDDAEKVLIEAASATNIQFIMREGALNHQRVSRGALVGIYFYEPDLFKQAIRLYKNRDYKAAQPKFAECREAFAKIDDLQDNYSTLAGFYEIECTRKLGDLEGMTQLMDNFRPGALVREEHKNQMEIFTLWDAVRTKSWRRIIADTPDMLAQNKWTGTQLAQIYYCRGLAFEGSEETSKALNAFNGTITADYTASEELTRKATVNCLTILKDHEEVQLAMKLYGSKDEDKNSTGYLLLQEGVALCELWDKALGGGKPLPAEFQTFLKFKGQND
jgi:hypothetical protein